MFRTNFWGPLETTPRTNFAQFSQTRGMFLKSASVQANHVSMLGPRFGHETFSETTKEKFQTAKEGLDCDSAALVQLSKQPKCPKVLNESAKGVFGSPE